jgi:hypothetical protein
MVPRISLALFFVGAPLLLSACGTDQGDRTVSGQASASLLDYMQSHPAG